MRAISLVNHIEFSFNGNVARNAIVLGDLDNDGCNELVIGNTNGDMAVFKGRKKLQVISKLTFVSCLAIGDIFNEKKNHLVIVTADGWCYIYKAIIRKHLEDFDEIPVGDFDSVDGQVFSSGSTDGFKDDSSFSSKKDASECGEEDKLHLNCVHIQRIPANSKDILLADINDDGFVEMVLGLTDRVVRSYRWFPFNEKTKTNNLPIISDVGITVEKSLGKLVALNKWECANQIGSITLHHGIDGLPTLLVAQPGGTFMRIKCHNLETSDKSGDSGSSSSNDSLSSSSMVDYQYLGRSRMRSQNISTEILGDLKTGDEGEDGGGGVKRRPYAVATLDGTIMLVKNEEILWAMAVDHQIFALTKLDVTGSNSDEIVACAWDGQTYILDQDRNSVRFHFEQSVQAFTSGYYNLTSNENAVTCFVYVTFKNTVVIYYDIPLKDMNCLKFDPDLTCLINELVDENNDEHEIEQRLRNLDKNSKKAIVDCLLYKEIT